MIERIGEPLHAFKMATGAYRVTEHGNRIYTVAQGKPCVFYVIDADHAKELASFVLEGSNHSWGMCVTPDGSVYIGGDGYLYHYNPTTNNVRNCGLAIAGETYFWRLAADEHGNVYGGTYPGGKVFQYNAKTDQFRDYGHMMDEQYYARCMDMGPNNKLYVGLGTHKAEIVELDTITGEITRLEQPSGVGDCIITYDLDIYEGLLFARYTDVLELHIYDINKRQWVYKIEGASGYDVSAPDDKSNVYLLRNKQLHAFNLVTFELTPLPLQHEYSACDFGWLSFTDLQFPGQSLVTLYGGGYVIYNPLTQQSKYVELAIKGTPTAIQAIALDDEDKLHIGGYFTGGYASYDAELGQFSENEKIGQPENMYYFKGKLYFGVYPGANIFEYDPTIAWQKDTNPKLVFSLYDDEQDRPFAMTATKDKLVVGTIPKYSKLGGALAFYDPATSILNSYVNIVENQSIIALCYDNGIIYGGTSVYGGLGGKPKAEDGVLFGWDTVKQEKIFEIVPVRGEKVVSALSVGPDGLIWGMTTGHLFTYDPAIQAIVFLEQMFEPLNWENRSHYWRGVYIDYDLTQHIIYGNCIDKLFKYNVKTKSLDILATEGHLYARDKKGNIYFTKETELYKYIEENGQ